MVAAWMRAETGVGAAMASGSQTRSGSWADLPQAAKRKRSPRSVTMSGARSPALAFSSVRDVLARLVTIRARATR